MSDDLERLRTALTPFAAIADAADPGWPDDTSADLLIRLPNGDYMPRPTLGDCRRAREALGSTGNQGEAMTLCPICGKPLRIALGFVSNSEYCLDGCYHREDGIGSVVRIGDREWRRTPETTAEERARMEAEIEEVIREKRKDPSP